MTMRDFFLDFPRLAETERRTLENPKEARGGAPWGHYPLCEHYCDVPGCDCRQVAIHLKLDGYPWPMAGFLLALDAPGDPKALRFDPLHHQERFAPRLRTLLAELLDQDPDYLPCLQRHYAQARERCDGHPYAGAPFAGPVAPVPDGVDVLPLPPRPAAPAPAPAPPDPAAAQALEEEARALVESVLAWQRENEHLGRDRGSWDHLIPQSMATGRNLALPLLRLLLNHYGPSGRRRTLLDGYAECLILLGAALMQLQRGGERGWPWALALLDQVQTEMAETAFVPEVDERVQRDLLQTLHTNQVPLSPLLRERAHAVISYYTEFSKPHGRFDPERETARLVENLAGEDPFATMHRMLAQLDPLPFIGWIGLVRDLMGHPDPGPKELAMLALLHPNPLVRIPVAHLLGDYDDGVRHLSPVGLRRLIGLRNWLPAAERPAVDALIKAARKAGVVAAPLPPVEPAAIYAAPIDGWGGHGLWAFVTAGADLRAGVLVLTQGSGVEQAATEGGLTRADMQDMIRGPTDDFALLVDRDYLDRLIAHCIAVGQGQHRPPPPHLLAFNELVGGDYWKPQAVDPAAEIAALIAADPAAFGHVEVARTLVDSASWPEKLSLAAGWFEDGAEVETLLHAQVGPFASWLTHPSAAVAVVLQAVIEPKRALWTERLLWTALRARAAAGAGAVPWQAFVILAQALHADTDLALIPLMVTVARRTVGAAWGRAQRA